MGSIVDEGQVLMDCLPDELVIAGLVVDRVLPLGDGDDEPLL